MAKRIQRKRTKGWRMPESAKSVTRPGKWGNPFRVGWYYKIGDPSKTLMSWCTSYDVPDRGFVLCDSAEKAVAMYREYLSKWPHNLSDLRDKDLACFCRLDATCHADVLLELANS